MRQDSPPIASLADLRGIPPPDPSSQGRWPVLTEALSMVRERLGRYVRGFHPEFVGLTGGSDDVAAAARRFFIGYNGTGEAIVHTEAVGLVDAEGRLRGVYGQGKLGRIGDDLVDLLAGGRL